MHSSDQCNPGIENETNRSDRRIADAELADSIQRLGVKTFLELWQETPLIRSQKEIPTNHRAFMQANRLENTSVGLARSLRHRQGSAPNLWPEIGKPLCLPTHNWRKRHEIYEHCSTHATSLPNASHVTS